MIDNYSFLFLCICSQSRLLATDFYFARKFSGKGKYFDSLKFMATICSAAISAKSPLTTNIWL